MLSGQRNNLKGVSRDPQSSQLTMKDESGQNFVLTQLNIKESLSALSLIEATVLTNDLEGSEWLGQYVTCEIFNQLSTSRKAIQRYGGVVVGVESLFGSEKDKTHSFLLTVRPWLALLQYSRAYRVFQDQSSQEIVTSIFNELGFKGQYRLNALPSTKREYCLQYNETDYDFVCRILAQEGIHFYFFHDHKSTKLILQDASKPFSSRDKLSFDSEVTKSGTLPVMFDWRPQLGYHAAKLELTSYDPKQTKLVKSPSITSDYPLVGNRKLIDVRYAQASISGQQDDLAKVLAKIKRSQLDSQHKLVNASTEHASINCGQYINLASHIDPSQLGDYLVLSSEYQYHVDASGQLSQTMQLTCCPKDHPFYPTENSKPLIHGIHSAVVSGAKKHEPSSDNEGRVKIRFHWDDTDGEKTSCWVRVAQLMAGNGYGMQFTPRAGQEVLISFLDGDIDKPVVTGSVYNGKHKVPYADQDTTQSGIKTKLSGEFNELRFDDKKDNEELYLHAAKNYALEVANDISIKVLNDSKEAVTGEHTLVVEKDMNASSAKNYTLTVKESILEKAKTITLEAQDTITFKVGSSELVMSSSKIEFKSSEITLTGDSKVLVDGAQVSIKGQSKVDINSSAGITIKATADLKASGLNAELSGTVGAKVKGAAMAEISASGMAVVKGGVVMVN